MQIRAMKGCALLALIYSLTGILLTLLSLHPQIINLWLPAGLALACLLKYGLKLLPGVFLGNLLFNLWLNQHFGSQALTAIAGSFLIAAGASAQATVACYSLKRFVAEPLNITRAEHAWKFSIFGAFLPCLINATIGTLSLHITQSVFNLHDAVINWSLWWTADTFGTLLGAPLAMAFIQKPSNYQRLTAKLGLTIVSVLVFNQLYFHQLYKQLEMSFEQQIQVLQAQLQSIFERNLADLAQLERYVSQHGHISAKEFSAKAEPLLRRNPSMRAYSWDPLIPKSQQHLFETQLSHELGRPIKVSPPSLKADEPLMPVKYIMPMSGNTPALGFNLLSTPSRRDWILAAQKNGRVQATRILHLAQAPNKAGMLVLQPVYRSSVEQSLMDNQRQLIGFLVGVFTVDQMIRTALNYSHLDHIDLQLFENHAITPTYSIISEENIGPQRQAFNETFHVSLAGQQWQLLATASQRYILQRLSPQHLPMQLLLMIAASLAAFMMMMQQSRETHLNSEVAHKTRDLNHLARHDPLTGLPNRRAMKEAIQRLATQTTPDHAALLFIDLDRFKLINDTLGHQTGDQLLIYLGQRLQQQLTSDQYLFRMGGDEFLILSPYQSESKLRQLAEHLLAICSQSVDLANGPHIQVTASIGISLYPRDGKDLDTLIKHADTAMYRAKAQGKNQFFCYTPALTDATREHFELEQSLRQAISQHQLTVYYQPQYTLNDATPCGLEALVRWQHPQKGMISPGTFIPIAEETQLIIPLGWEVLHQVCRQLRRWQHEGLHVKRVAVNLSPVQLMQADFFSQLSRMINSYGIQPQQLELEITESTLQNDPDYVLELLQRLRHRGHLLSLDDFGTGYSSFRRLKTMPIHRLKIDQGFVRDIGSDQTDEAIIHAMIALGHSLNMSVLAEGVETAEQLDFLYRAGCDEVQGFLTGHPTAAEQVTWSPLKNDLKNRLLLELNNV